MTRARKAALDLTDLQVFLAVVQERGFSRAASKLGCTQPAVSLAVRRLEARLGHELFDRTSNPGLLTQVGRVFKEYADRLVRLADEAEASVQDFEDLQRGRVVIGTNDAGVYALLPLIERFQAAHPGILVDLQRVPSRQMAADLVHGSLEFGLMNFHSPERRLRSISLGSDELVAIVAPTHPFAKRATLKIADWAREPIIFHNESSPARERAIRLAEQRQSPLNVRLAMPTLDGIKLAVQLGLGVSLMPHSCAADEIKRGDLVAVSMPEFRFSRPVQLAYHRARRLSHAAAAFLQVASQCARSRPPNGVQPRGNAQAARSYE